MQLLNRSETLVFRAGLSVTALLIALILCGCGAPYSVSLLVTPGTASVALGDTAQFTVIARYTNGESQDVTSSVSWSTLDTGVARMNTAGAATSVHTGTTTVVASLHGATGRATITVSNAALTAISIAVPAAPLAAGLSEQLRATGTYSNDSTADITDAVTWSAAQPAVLAVSSDGMAVGKAAGNTQIGASLSGISASAQIVVAPPVLSSIVVQGKSAALPLGTSEQLTATGTYSDKSTRDLTASAVWTSAAPGVLAVSGSGSVVAKSIGSAAVAASVSNVTGNATVSVTAAQPVSLSVSASNASLPVGDTLQLSAVAAYTDGSTRDLTGTALWTSSSPSVLSIRGSGLVAGLTVGAATVTASTGGISGEASLAVSAPALASIALTPAGPTVPLGSTLQLALTGTYSDGSTQDVTGQATWNLETPGIASVTPSGVVTGLQVGATSIEAALNGVRTSDTLTVQPLLAVDYFDAGSGADSTIRVTNPALTGQDLCAMIYIFDKDQQMSECCGCLVSQDSLLTLSLRKNLLSNPLTGVASTAGTVMVVPAAQSASGNCNASSLTPAGTLLAWSTRLPVSQSGSSVATEDPFSGSPLTAASAAAVQAQCSFVQQLGSGQGICGCGNAQY